MRQLIAGNWKMHGRLADVAAYAAALRPGARPCRPAGLPAFSAPRPFCRRARRQRRRARRAGLPRPGPGRAYRRRFRPHAERGRRHLCDPRPFRAAREPWRNRCRDLRQNRMAAMAAGLTPIVCVGETGTEREAGMAEEVVRTQLRHSLPEDFSGVVAYEPVWAIGTGKTPTEADVAAMHGAIRAALVAQLGAAGARMQNSLWRLGEAGQCRQPAGPARGGRRAGRRRQPEGRRFLGHCCRRAGRLEASGQFHRVGPDD